jgi:hypothetical protein
MKRPRSEIAAAINPDSVLVVDQAVASQRADPKSEEEASLLALIDGKRTVAEVLRMSRMSGFVAMRRLRSLLEGQVIRPAGRAPTAPAGMPAAKPGRLGLTQDLTSAAVSFAAQMPQKKPADADAGSAGAKNDDKPRPSPGMTAPPAAARPTPLQGSTALPSVIITFGPDFREPRSMPTRRLPGTAPPPPEKQTQTRPTSPGATTITLPEKADLVERPKSVELVPVAPPAEKAVVSLQKTAIMPRANGRRLRRRTPATSGEIEAQELWLAVTRRDWQTLAVIPAHRDGSALSLATALAEAGSLLRGKPVELFSADRADSHGDTHGDTVLNARNTSPITLNPVPAGGLPPSTEKFGRVVALEPLSSNPAGATIAQSAEAVLMVAERGVTELRTARRTVEMIGRDRFLGCVLVSPAK